MGIPEGEEWEKGAERLFKEIIAEKFSNLQKKLDIHVHEAKRTPNCLSAKRPSLRHIILKLSKVNDKERIFKGSQGKKRMVTYKGTHRGYQKISQQKVDRPGGSRMTSLRYWKMKTITQGLPWWRSGWESACQCRRHGFEPWSGNIPHAAEQLSPCATTTEPLFHNYGSPHT